MKKIKVHGQVMDNAGDLHDAGSVLTVDDEGGKGCVDAKRAAHLVKIHSAAAEGKGTAKAD